MEGSKIYQNHAKIYQNQPKYANICIKERKNTQKLSAFCRFCYIIVPRKARLARECGHRFGFLARIYRARAGLVDFARRILRYP